MTNSTDGDGGPASLAAEVSHDDDSGVRTAAVADPPDQPPAGRPSAVRRLDLAMSPAALAVTRRLALILTAALAVTALGVWLTPVTVSGHNGYPFGCGSAAHPNATGFGRQVCGTAVSARGVLVLVLLIAAVACGLLTGLLSAQVSRLLPGLLTAVPLLAAAAFWIFAPLEARGVDGSAVQCGRGIAPADDPFSRGLCADLPGNRLGAGLTVAALAVVLGVGLTYTLATGSGARPGDLDEAP